MEQETVEKYSNMLTGLQVVVSRTAVKQLSAYLKALLSETDDDIAIKIIREVYPNEQKVVQEFVEGFAHEDVNLDVGMPLMADLLIHMGTAVRRQVEHVRDVIEREEKDAAREGH